MEKGNKTFKGKYGVYKQALVGSHRVRVLIKVGVRSLQCGRFSVGPDGPYGSRMPR